MNDRTIPRTREGFSLLPVLALAAGHGAVDVYGSFLAPLFPLFADKFGLSLTLVGTLASILTIADGLSQPIFGYWGDRMRRPWMAVAAPFWVGLFTGLLGLATGYGMLALLLVLAGIGRSGYHPQGAAAVAQYAGTRRGFSMSLFTAAGNLGYASGPLLATAAVALGGLGGTVYTTPLGFVVTGLIYAIVFRDIHFRSEAWRPPPLKMVLTDLAGQRRALSRLWIVVVLRNLIYFGSFTFLPILFSRKGLSPVQTGLMVSVFLYGGSMGGLLGGWLSDRMGEKAVIVASLALAFPTLQLALSFAGLWGTFFLMLGGGCLLASTPVSVALAQRYAPGSMATASSLMLGLGWGTGGLLVTPVGVLADQIGPVGALRILGCVLVVAVILAVGLPSRREPRPVLD